jgi:hypothetical protein
MAIYSRRIIHDEHRNACVIVWVCIIISEAVNAVVGLSLSTCILTDVFKIVQFIHLGFSILQTREASTKQHAAAGFSDWYVCVCIF